MFMRVARLTTRGQTLPTLIGVALLVSVFVTLSITRHYPHEDGNAKPGLDVGKLPLSFEPNVGQVSVPAKFIARAPGSTIYFSPSDLAIEVESVVPDHRAITAGIAHGENAAPTSLMSGSKFKGLGSAVLDTPSSV